MIRARLAPTPSGHLHWGNLYNFVLTWGEVRRAGGRLALRIDDLDATRARPEYVEDIFRTLEWLGFDWDEGPSGPDDFFKYHSQLSRIAEYRSWLSKWPGYACACSRQEIKLRTQLHYDGFCRQRRLPHVKDQTAWRSELGDIILWRKDDLPAYHLVSLVEDLRFATNLLVRGKDLQDATAQQQQLALALGASGESFVNARTIHHALLLDEQGNKLSKSAQASSLSEWRKSGKTAEQIFLHLSQLLIEQGIWSTKVMVRSLSEAKQLPYD